MPSAYLVRPGRGLGACGDLWVVLVGSWGVIGTHPNRVPLGSLRLPLDFDDDGTLNREDLSQLVNCLTGEGEDTRLSASEMKQLIDNVSGWAPGGTGPQSPRMAMG